MARYYCVYDKVKELAEETEENAKVMADNTKTYDDEIEDFLLGSEDMYDGKSRDALDNRLHNENGLVNGSSDITNFGYELSKHIIEAADKIKSLDVKLAQLKI